MAIPMGGNLQAKKRFNPYTGRPSATQKESEHILPYTPPYNIITYIKVFVKGFFKISLKTFMYKLLYCNRCCTHQ